MADFKSGTELLGFVIKGSISIALYSLPRGGKYVWRLNVII